MNRIMIAGTASGVGKTTFTLGIMAALKRRGKIIAPFKVGPDYIDPGFHSFVTGNPSHNLDSWLLHEETLKYLFKRNMENKDIAVIEGVMGLYDGFGLEKDNGSSAHVSKILDTPVILIADGKGLSSSIAAMILGYKMYDENINIKGVILNNISSNAHYEMLKKVIERDVQIDCLGYLPTNSDISLNSRHLGLIPSDEVENLNGKIDMLSELIEETIDLDRILDISSVVNELPSINNPAKNLTDKYKGLTIGVAKDEAFSFYYEDNLKLLKELGVTIKYFSPLRDNDIPKNIDGLYIGGGFPEVFAPDLEKNNEFKNNLLKSLENGLPSYAECGGLMYLTKEIENLDGNKYEMIGFLPTSSKMTKRLQRFGYVEIDSGDEIKIKGHEFHRSMIDDNPDLNYKYDVYKIREGKINKRWKCGVVKNNTLSAYAHIHFYSNLEFLIRFLNKCKENSVK